MLTRRQSALLVLVGLTIASPSAAEWPGSPFVNVAVSSLTSGYQRDVPVITSDGSGGAFIFWQEIRSTNPTWKILGQHIETDGTPDSRWPAGGLNVNPGGEFYNPKCAADGTGGAFVVASYISVMATHVANNGKLIGQLVLPVRGIGYHSALEVCSDGDSGAFVVSNWPMDLLVVQHLRADCTVDGELELANASQDGAYPGPTRLLVSDGNGAALVAWKDRSGLIRVTKVLQSGLVASSWPDSGLPLAPFFPTQSNPRLVGDGQGGALIAWEDRQTVDSDIYIQHVRANGAVDPEWPLQGLRVCLAPNDQTGIAMVPDQQGGALLSWQDLRSGDWNIYAHHVLGTGGLDPRWPTDGKPVCLANNPQALVRLSEVYDGAATAGWTDARAVPLGGYYPEHIFAQRVRLDGSDDRHWPANGRALSLSDGSQHFVEVVSDARGGVIGAWTQLITSGASVGIYAQRADSMSYLGPSNVEVPMAVDPQSGGLRVSPRIVDQRSFDVAFDRTAAPQGTLSVIDVAGRTRIKRDVSGLPVGNHHARFDNLVGLAPGVYFVSLRQGGESASVRIAVTR